MKLSIGEKDLQKILACEEHKESISFAGEVKDDTLYLQETYSGGSVFWSLSRCLDGKSTGYAKYTPNGVILCGVHNKTSYEIRLLP